MNMKAHNKEHNKEEQPYMSEKLVIFNRIYKEYNEIYHKDLTNKYKDLFYEKSGLMSGIDQVVDYLMDCKEA